MLPLRRLLAVSRPALWVNTLGVLTVGVWLSGELWPSDPRVWALYLYFTLPYNLLIYGVNDLCDRHEDALSPRKGGVQGARLRPDEVPGLRRSIWATNLPFLALLPTLPPAAAGVLLLAAGLFVAYSLPPLRFKGRPVLDSLSNVAYALPLVVPALLAGAAAPILALGVLSLYSVGKHAFDAAQDADTDQRAGTRTVATRLGVRGAALFALACFVGAALVGWPLARVGSAALLLVMGGLCVTLLRRPTPLRAARLYPLSILSPWLIGPAYGVPLVALLARGGQP